MNAVQFVEVLFFSRIFIMKKSIEFNVTSFGNLKDDCIIKAREMFNFLILINSSVTIEFIFLLLIVSAIISSKTINVLRFSSGLYSSPKKNHKFLDKSIYFWLAFQSYCFHGHA